MAELIINPRLCLWQPILAAMNDIDCHRLYYRLKYGCGQHDPIDLALSGWPAATGSTRRRLPIGSAGARRPMRRWAEAPRSTVLSQEEEAIVVAFRNHTLLPLD